MRKYESTEPWCLQMESNNFPKKMCTGTRGYRCIHSRPTRPNRHIECNRSPCQPASPPHRRSRHSLSKPPSSSSTPPIVGTPGFREESAEHVLHWYETRLQRCCLSVSAARYVPRGGGGCARYLYRCAEGLIELFKGLIKSLHLQSSVLMGLPLLDNSLCDWFGQRPLVACQFWRSVLRPHVHDRRHPVCLRIWRDGDDAHFRPDKESKRNGAVREKERAKSEKKNLHPCETATAWSDVTPDTVNLSMQASKPSSSSS